MSTEAGQRPPGTVTEGSPEILTGKESSLKLPVKKRVVSGVQPTGNLHFGNYLGAIKQWATNQARGAKNAYMLLTIIRPRVNCILGLVELSEEAGSSLSTLFQALLLYYSTIVGLNL